MKKEAKYNTKQRDVLLELLKRHQNEHLIIKDIMKYVDKNNLKIGMTTVYRYLNILVSDGLVRRYSTDGFDGNCYQFVENNEKCHQHLHLRCTSCEKLFHVDDVNVDLFNQTVEKEKGFSVDTSKTVLYGICRECRCN